METIWLDEVDSTNSEILRHPSDFANMSVVAARRQTAGRGQRGSVWTSTEAENLTFSILLRPGLDGVPSISARDQFKISEITTVALHEYLEENGIESHIKWPNDIYCGDRKICGILIENTVRDDSIVSSVIGIGLNLNQTEFPPEIPNPASMRMLTGLNYVPEEELKKFISHFKQILYLPDNKLLEKYLSRMYRRNELHSFVDSATGAVFNGIIRGISPAACLLVELPDGTLREFAFKEIGYII